MGCAGSAGLTVTPAGAARFFERYEMAEFIGQGTFGEVRAARPHASEPHSAHGADLAVKIVGFDTETCHEPQRVNRERALWQTLGRHPNIVALKACFLDVHRSKCCAFFVMERCLGNLRDRRPNQHELKGVLVDIFEAVAHVHSCGIVHRDIKLTNLLWSHSHVKLCDSGSARKLDADVIMTSSPGMPPCLSPDASSGVCSGYPVDIWCCGVVVYHLLYKKLPFMPGTDRIENDAFKQAPLHEANIALCFPFEDVVQL